MMTLLIQLVISLILHCAYFKAKLQKMYGRNTDLKEIYGIITTSVTQRCSNRSYYLESRFKTNMYQDMNYYVPIQDEKR